MDSHTCANSLAFLETITRMSSRISDRLLPFLETMILSEALDTRLALKLQRYACFCLQGDGIKLSTHSRVLIGMNFSGKNFVSFLSN